LGERKGLEIRNCENKENMFGIFLPVGLKILAGKRETVRKKGVKRARVGNFPAKGLIIEPTKKA
jgi:hypothetical protein